MKKVLVFLVPVILVGAVLGLAMAGVIQIPGLSPKKKTPPVAVAKQPNETKASNPRPKPDKQVEAPKAKQGDPVKGYETVAELWNGMEVPKLVEITDQWQDEDLGPILLRMEPDKVVSYLAVVKADRAARLTKVIQRLAELEPG